MIREILRKSLEKGANCVSATTETLAASQAILVVYSSDLNLKYMIQQQATNLGESSQPHDVNA